MSEKGHATLRECLRAYAKWEGGGALQRSKICPSGMVFHISSLQRCLKARWRIYISKYPHPAWLKSTEACAGFFADDFLYNLLCFLHLIVVFSTMHPERHFIDFCTISNTFPKTFGEVFGEG